MLSWIFHAWERRLAAIATDRVVRPFEWGLEWLDEQAGAPEAPPAAVVDAWASTVMRDSDAFYHVTPADAYVLDGERLTFPSALVTPHAENNVVHARVFPAAPERDGARRAVVVLPQWNADPEGHVALSRLIARFGVSALRLTLPYHEARMPPELTRADYIVSSNIVRTAQVCRQAVLDARRAVAWLARQGYDRIGILGTSLGSCLAMLTTAHEPLIRAAALNHISPYFADVVWEGLSTAHVRQGLDGRIDLERLRRMWLPISPFPFLDRVKGRKILLVYARYDLTFPVRLSRMLVEEFRARGIEPEVAVLPCGHYSTGVAPFSWMDAFVLIRFLRRAL
ncbi:MAG TPA: alpha/beta hydrolase family protein [Vicinamibacterales bacterium]|nr:alpha/beta hydrolase family protein [Vicinamibacterales bacterium]